jgi:aspartate/methionine/tyrosine aminotransferase
MHDFAVALNASLRRDCPSVLSMLSPRGVDAYFPSDGILGQTAQARGSRLNATIGIALDDDGLPMRLQSIAMRVNVPPENVFPYAPAHGLPALRAEWKKQIMQKNPSIEFLTSLPVVTAGLTHALHIAGDLLISPGATLIIPEPMWENYGLVFPHAAVTAFPAFDAERFNIAGLRASLPSSGTCAVLLNFPNNPTGYSPTLADARAIVDALHEAAERGLRIAVILDDAYFGLVHDDGILRESLFASLGNLHERILAVKVDGASKEDFAWGLRVAFLTYAAKSLTEAAAKALEEKTAGLIRASVSSACHLSQTLLLDALCASECDREKRANEATLRSRFLSAKREARDGPWSLLPCNAGYFLCLKLDEGIHADAVRTNLLERHAAGVIALPGNLLRIAYCSVREGDIPELFGHIRKACAEQRTPSR